MSRLAKSNTRTMMVRTNMPYCSLLFKLKKGRNQCFILESMFEQVFVPTKLINPFRKASAEVNY
ncbi:MAG: hypothetical protein A2W85_11475 [Bacteroidetes bacterium GWF2_41_31]|nr:MAG: hypothetical protein A2W85_11475 [Bacteroidetes bacterium GWF2_41_31]